MNNIEDLVKAAPQGEQIRRVGEEIIAMLLEKNIAYGNSALEPIRIFSDANTREQLFVRIDDKLNRIMQGSNDDEDVVMDLIGYLILLKVYDRMLLANNIERIADIRFLNQHTD